MAADIPNPRTTGTPFLRVWRSSDYDASPVNWRVLQHPTTGLVYVSNNFGVLEFDGAGSRLIPMPRGGAARALVLDPTGNIWVGGVGELARLEPDATGRLAAVDATDQIASGATGRETAAAADDNEPSGSGTRLPERKPLPGLGNLNRAIAGADGVYFRLPDTIAFFPPHGTPRLIPASGRIGQLWWMADTLHATDLERGVLRLRDGQLQPLAPALAFDAFAAQRKSDGTWRILTTRGPHDWDGHSATTVPLDVNSEVLFAGEEPTCALFLPDGRIAYGTTRSGLVLFDSSGRFERKLGRSEGLPANRINGLATDRDGGLWLAMHAGLVRAQLDSPFAVHGAARGFAGGPRHLLRVADRLYVTHGEGLAWRSDADGEFHAVPGLRTGSHRLAPWRDRVLATASGLYELTPPSEQPRHTTGPYFYALLPLRSSPNDLLISAATSLRLFRHGTNGWSLSAPMPALPAGADDLLETEAGIVWVVTRTAELWRLDLRSTTGNAGSARRYGPEQGVPLMLRRDGVRLLQFGRDLVVSSARQLLRYDVAGDRFVPETRFPELRDAASARFPSMAVPAPDGGAWFYGDGAAPWIAHVQRATATTGAPWKVSKTSVAPLQNLIANHLYADPALRTLWIATQGTLLSYDLDWKPHQQSPALQPIVRRVATPDGQTLPLTQLATLGADITGLRFEYAAPFFAADYTGTTGTHYRTRLLGLESDWTAWSPAAQRDFTNLPPGYFSLEVQARDFSGRISASTTIAFMRAAPWWRTGWALVGGIVVIAGAFIAGVRLRTRALHHRAERLEGLVAARTQELATRNAELARLHKLELDEKTAARLAEETARLEALRYQLNPHFLFNALNSIYGLVYPHSRPAGELVRGLADFCRNTLTRGRDSWHSLGEEFAILRTYLDIEQARWRERLNIEIQLQPEAAAARVPAFLLLPLVENAIKHGGATSPAVLQLRLTAARNTDGSIRIDVANTGSWLVVGDSRRGSSTGIGRENLKARLARCFPDRHTLATEERDGWVNITLTLAPDESALPPSDNKASLAASLPS